MQDELLDKLEDMGAEVDDVLDRLMGDEELYMEYLKKLPDNENIVKLKEAVANKDAEQASMEVHTLKGVALNLGILPLVDVCMDMLLDFRGGEPESAMARMGEVEDCFNEWASVIRQYED